MTDAGTWIPELAPEVMTFWAIDHAPALYAAIRREALEEAAKACEALDDAECDTGYGPTQWDCARAIRAMMEPKS